jgi:hypothetical protein
MLTADLVRAQVRKGELRPSFIDTSKPEWRERAAELCDLYCEAKGRRRAEVDEDIADLIGDDRHHLVTRGLARLLDDRSEWDVGCPIDPVELRRFLFSMAAENRPLRSLTHGSGTPRADIIQAAAERFELDTASIEQSVFGDLKEEQRLMEHRPLGPEQLLERYNVSLVQALLLRADRVHLTVAGNRPSRVRQLFRWLKFYQLMHRAHKSGRSRWDIEVDGPLSIFQQGQRYGLQLANFFPAVLLLEGWALEATIPWGDERKPLPLRLTSEDGLVTHLRSRGTWQSDEEKLLLRKLGAVKGWQVAPSTEILAVGGQDVVVPDFVLTHEATGRTAVVELVGYWRSDYMKRRAKLLAEHAPSNLLLCVSRRLRTCADDESWTWPDQWLEYAGVVSPTKLIELADRFATADPA